MERGCIQGLPKFFWVPPIISGTGKATNFKFCMHILSIDRNKSPLQISGKVVGCVVRTLKTFQCTHILGTSRGLLCDSSAVLFEWITTFSRTLLQHRNQQRWHCINLWRLLRSLPRGATCWLHTGAMRDMHGSVNRAARALYKVINDVHPCYMVGRRRHQTASFY